MEESGRWRATSDFLSVFVAMAAGKKLSEAG
jgi:hypothetical protein